MITAACALLAIGCFAYVFAPVPEVEHGREKTRLVYLRERKEVIYENLRDLNFEFKAGKFPQADYEQMRSAMETEAAGVLAEIEALERLAN